MPNSLVAPENLRGMNLINSPIWNKGTAFTPEERDAFALEGLLPPYFETLEEQVAKAYGGLRPETSNLDKHIFLRSLQDTNEVLFYRLLLDHPEELLPLIYRPILAEACLRFNDIYRRPRGLFISYPFRGRIPELLRSRPYSEVDIIVVTDGERIFGLGDAGVNGLSVPISKLSLYTLFGGIHPSRTLPVVLDVGTNNRELLDDPTYAGWRHERISGQEYSDFVDQFVQAVKEELPGTCLQWEDFAPENAGRILRRYQSEVPTFNDNLQGTAAAVTGTLLAGFRAAGNVLRNGEVILLGTGPDALTTADYLCHQMESEGLCSTKARERIWLMDKHGLLHDARRDLTSEQRSYAQSSERISSWGQTRTPGITDVIRNVRASALIGFPDSACAIDEGAIREMAIHAKRPIVLTVPANESFSPAEPDNYVQWSGGRGLSALCRSLYIFPAVGLGVAISRATHITDGMMLAAARALGQRSPIVDGLTAALLPPISELRDVIVDVATAVGCEAQNEGLAPRLPMEELRQEIRDAQWRPEYPALVPEVAV